MPEAVWNGDPDDFVNGTKVSAEDMNDILNRLMVLKYPESANYECDEDSDYTTSSTSWVDVDDENLALTLDTNGGDVMVGFHCAFKGASPSGVANTTFFDVDVDGTRVAGDDGIICKEQDSTKMVVSFVRLITDLSADSHTFKLQWMVTASSATIYAGAGTSNTDVHPQFWVREVS